MQAETAVKSILCVLAGYTYSKQTYAIHTTTQPHNHTFTHHIVYYTCIPYHASPEGNEEDEEYDVSAATLGGHRAFKIRIILQLLVLGDMSGAESLHASQLSNNTVS
jgi:hypothetical protein